MTPTLKTGKICYIEIPATDIARSAEFYRSVFGWQIRKRGDGAVAFDDTVNEVSGTWVGGRAPNRAPGLMVHIMVADAGAAAKAIVANGGEIVLPVDPDSPVVFAHFRDPGGNVLGIYEQEGLKETDAAGR